MKTYELHEGQTGKRAKSRFLSFFYFFSERFWIKWIWIKWILPEGLNDPSTSMSLHLIPSKHQNLLSWISRFIAWNRQLAAADLTNADFGYQYTTTLHWALCQLGIADGTLLESASSSMYSPQGNSRLYIYCIYVDYYVKVFWNAKSFDICIYMH